VLTASYCLSSSSASMSHHASDPLRNGGTPSSSGSKRSRHKSSSRMSHDGFSPRRRHLLAEDAEHDGMAGSGDESESDVDSQTTSPRGPLSSLSSSQSVKRRRDEKAVDGQRRKRQHQKSDKQRRDKIKDGMEQLKALVSLQGRLESPEQAGIVGATVNLVHALRTEIACLRQVVERATAENASMRGGGGREVCGFGGLHGVSLLRGGLGSSAALPLLLSQLSSLSQLNSSLSSLSASSLSGLNALNRTGE
jgi:hypothetical protein